jgi:hypothetical protein
MTTHRQGSEDDLCRTILSVSRLLLLFMETTSMFGRIDTQEK